MLIISRAILKGIIKNPMTQGAEALKQNYPDKEPEAESAVILHFPKTY